MGEGDLELKLRVIIFRDDDGPWIAQGLEHDICAQGESLTEVMTVFEKTLEATCQSASKKDDPLAKIPPAPEHFFTMFKQASLSLKNQKEQKRQRQMHSTRHDTSLRRIFRVNDDERALASV